MSHAPVEAVQAGVKPGFAAFVIYVVAFVVGAIVMSFEMLGSRYLNPYFGSGIYTWASLISTVLAALTVGYFIGGWLADRRPSASVLGATVLIGSVYLLFLPLFAPMPARTGAGRHRRCEDRQPALVASLFCSFR